MIRQHNENNRKKRDIFLADYNMVGIEFSYWLCYMDENLSDNY